MSYFSGSQRRPSRIRSVSSHEHVRNTMTELDEPLRTKTGRLSKALKGLRVHRCDQCGKVYSRREHLKRHQYNHQRSPLQCKVCHKAFFRRDLLERHILKYGHPSSHSPSLSPERDSPSVESICNSQISSTAGLLSDSSAPITTFEDVKTILASAETGYPRYNEISSLEPSGISLPMLPQSSLSYSPPNFVSTLDPNLQSRPPFPIDQQIWPHAPIASDYPILPPSPVSGVSSPWLSSGYTHPSIPVVDSIEPFQNSYTNLNMSGMNALSPPESATPPKWELVLEHERQSLPTSTSSSPAPVSAVPPLLLPISGGGPEELLQNTQLSGILIPARRRTYTDAYWKHFHPVFPVIHNRQRSMQSANASSSMSAMRLLAVTMMAIGAQYSEQWFAPSDSRILHERCLEAISKKMTSIHSPTCELETMQAVVLAEFLSQFKAKRAPEDLSEAFRIVYDNLWKWHFVQDKSKIEELSRVIPGAGEDAVQAKWSEWIDFHSRERLLSACYILDSRNALLLGRQMHVLDTSLGLGLLNPASNLIWDAPNQNRWTQNILCKRPQPTTINQLLESIDCTADTTCDNFQSAVILACYSASILCQSQDAMGLTCPTHSLFEPFRANDLMKALSKHPSVRIMHSVTRLISLAPYRALVAAAGESWFFGKKLSDVAKNAAEEFKSLKGQLKAWTNDSTTFVMDPIHGSNTPFLASIKLALEIISQAITDPAPNLTLAFGPELALYVASLVCWAATFSSQQATGSHYEVQESDTAEWDSLRAENLARSFLPHAIDDVKAAIPPASTMIPPQSTNHYHHNSEVQHMVPSVAVDGMPLQDVIPSLVSTNQSMHQHHHHQFTSPGTAIFPPPVQLTFWRQGVASILRWTAWVLGGAANRNSGTGQLIEGLIEVLETLGRVGWNGDWF